MERTAEDPDVGSILGGSDADDSQIDVDDTFPDG
jgi:hypothetical protein